MPVHGAQTKKQDRFYIISPYFSIFFSKWNRRPVPLVSEVINERNEKWDCQSVWWFHLILQGKDFQLFLAFFRNNA